MRSLFVYTMALWGVGLTFEPEHLTPIYEHDTAVYSIIGIHAYMITSCGNMRTQERV